MHFKMKIKKEAYLNLNVLLSYSAENPIIFIFFGVDYTYNTFNILNYLILF